MNALEKLQAVQISADNQISEADRRFCKAHQSAYKEAKDMLSELKYIWEDALNRQHQLLEPYETSRYTLDKYISVPNFSVRDIEQRLENIHRVFINNLVDHFNSVYKVSLDSQEITDTLLPQKPKSDCFSPNTEAVDEYEKMMRSMTVEHKDVLDQIFIQLGGRTFLERALDEIKEACHKAAWCTYSGKAEYELKNDAVRFTYGCQFSDLFEKWELTDSMKKILRGLAYFESEILGYYPAAIENLLGYSRLEDPSVEFTSYTKLHSLRMFKNGRVDVKFKNKNYADKFASEYLGLVC